MQKKTYLQQSVQNGKIIRWADNCMPLRVYIAPFRFYSKVDENYKYREMVMKAFEAWQTISGGKVSFALVNSLLESQINLNWKRVDRHALGHCYFNTDSNGRLFSAEIQIGISDGLMHQKYMDEGEVYHTILHEIGHAIGLGHSPFDEDIMYSPHRYGVVELSAQDKLTLKWLYKLPLNSTIEDIGSKYGYFNSDLDEIVAQLIEKNEPSEFEKVKESLKSPEKDLIKEQENIADLKKYNIALQGIKISEDIKKIFIPTSPKNLK